MKKYYFMLLSAVVLCPTLIAQESDSSKWDVANPQGDWNFKEFILETDEGTWMNLDVSPDGKEIVFDLLGDLYKTSISGGKATLLRGGLPFEIQPRFSPDGSKILFTSDAGGGDNIWVMGSDGTDAKQLTKEDFRLLNNPVWCSDGNYFIARKHFTSRRSMGAGEMWMYHITGGTGTQLTKRKNDQQDVNEPSASPDGKYLYYSEDMYPGGMFLYNKDPNKQIYVIKRHNFKTGKTENVTGGPGGASRPQISSDGEKLAFVRRVRTKSVLFIHDLETGEEWPIFDQLNKDQQEAWAIFGTYPAFSWMPNNREIVFWAGGKINKIDINSLRVTNIPFMVKAGIKIAETLEVENPAFIEEFEAKMIRQATTSPDGKILVFNALGHIWKKGLPNGTPQRLTNSTDFEWEPSFSPDGKTIVYVTWDDENSGGIYKVPAKGGTPVKLSINKGIYRSPAYSKNGRQIVYRKEMGNVDQGLAFGKKPGLYIMEADGDNVKWLEIDGDYPMFNSDDSRILYQSGGTWFGNVTKELNSVNLNGKDKKGHVKSKYANRLIPSPDGKWIAFTLLHKIYLAPLPATGAVIELDNKTKAIPVTEVAKDAGINLHWSKDSKTIHWTLGDEYFTNNIADRFAFLNTSLDSLPHLTVNGLKIGLKTKSDNPNGSIAFINARIITMNGDEVIENGTILVIQNRIKAIGKTGEIEIPKSTKVYNIEGKTIMPGIVDVHAHVGGFRYALSPQKHWQFYANLAYGVTTTHDPSANTETIFTLVELIKSGEMVGPRLFSTGFILYGAERDIMAVIDNIEDARSSKRRTKAFGALSVKSYNQPRRAQRQQIIQAARENEVFVVPEGGSNFYHNMTMIMDGHTGIEHNIPIAPIYNDVKHLWRNSKVGYTPTLVVNYGGLQGECYWYQTTDVWKNKKLLKYTPRSIVDVRSRHRTMAPLEEYENSHILTSITCKTLSDVGVKINIGAHGQLQGMAAHWEIWMLVQGGISNMEALRAATINGAEYIGMGKDIGSIKTGKLADLIVLDENPLDDIRNTNSVVYTMVNGRLYDTSTMNEIGNRNKPRTKFYWENTKYNMAFDWHEETQSFAIPGCGCGLGH